MDCRGRESARQIANTDLQSALTVRPRTFRACASNVASSMTVFPRKLVDLSQSPEVAVSAINRAALSIRVTIRGFRCSNRPWGSPPLNRTWEPDCRRATSMPGPADFRLRTRRTSRRPPDAPRGRADRTSSISRAAPGALLRNRRRRRRHRPGRIRTGSRSSVRGDIGGGRRWPVARRDSVRTFHPRRDSTPALEARCRSSCASTHGIRGGCPLELDRRQGRVACRLVCQVGEVASAYDCAAASGAVHVTDIGRWARPILRILRQARDFAPSVDGSGISRGRRVFATGRGFAATPV